MGSVDRRLTIWILLAAIACLIGWDIYAAISPGDGDTISEVSLAFSLRHPSIAFLIGGLLGHLFWPLRDPPPRKITIPILVVLAAGVVACDFSGALSHGAALPAVALLIGLPMGHFLWGQERA